MLLQIFNLSGILGKPCLHIAGHVLDINGTLIGIAQDGRDTVITRSDDIAIMVSHIKYIVIGRR